MGGGPKVHEQLEAAEADVEGREAGLVQYGGDGGEIAAGVVLVDGDVADEMGPGEGFENPVGPGCGGGHDVEAGGSEDTVDFAMEADEPVGREMFKDGQQGDEVKIVVVEGQAGLVFKVVGQQGNLVLPGGLLQGGGDLSIEAVLLRAGDSGEKEGIAAAAEVEEALAVRGSFYLLAGEVVSDAGDEQVQGTVTFEYVGCFHNRGGWY